VHAVGALEDVGAAAAQDGAAAGQDPTGGLDRELLVDVLQRSAPPVAESDQLVAVGIHALAHDGTDDRVEARAVPTAREHPDTHGPTWYARARPPRRPPPPNPTPGRCRAACTTRTPGR